MFHFWFNTFFVREEVQVPEAPVNGNEDVDVIPPERAMSCDEQSRVPPNNIQQQRYVFFYYKQMQNNTTPSVS